jgi:mono/diheme cytochrome c family protein
MSRGSNWTRVPPVLVALISVASVAALPRLAQAIPIFANGQGVSCQQCHNAPPNLNAYGRYILATNFAKVLNAHEQSRANLQDPISLETTGNGSNTPDPTLPKTFVGLSQLLSGGFLGPEVTYYSSVPIVADGNPSSAVDQLWAAYNGFSHGNGSLQVGKFPTPMFAPWLSQSLSLAGYSLAAMPVGLNAVGVGDNRWGASYTQSGERGLVGNIAYVTNTGPLERAYNNSIASTTAGAEGRSVVASVQQMAINSQLTGGIAIMGGNFPLPSGATDRFTRTMALISYSTSPKYDIVAMALVGHDNNPNDGATPAAGSNGVSLEGIVGPLRWLHLDARYERTNDGLGTVANNYIGDIAVSILPNLVATVENVSSVGARPVMSYQVLWAGPWVAHRPGRGVAVAATGTPPSPASTASVAAGKILYAANCAACHGAAGGGGVGPSLANLSGRQTLATTIAFIEKPAAGGVMPTLYPATLSAAQVHDVATFIDATFK